MAADRGREWACRPRPAQGMHCGRHHSRSDDARDGRISARSRDAKASGLEPNPYHGRHGLRPYVGESWGVEFGIEMVLRKETFSPTTLIQRVREVVAKSRLSQKVLEISS